MCVYIYIYIYMYTYVYTHVYKLIYIYIYIYIHTYARVHGNHVGRNYVGSFARTGLHGYVGASARVAPPRKYNVYTYNDNKQYCHYYYYHH